MPAIAIPGACLPTYPNYFVRARRTRTKMNIGLLGMELLNRLNSNWPLCGTKKFGPQPASTWPVGEINTSGVLHSSQANQLVFALKGWRSDDWICTCGFHNYSSRALCKKMQYANASSYSCFCCRYENYRCKTQRDVVLQPVSVA